MSHSGSPRWAGPVIATGMTYSMFGQWGYSGAQITTAVLASGVWNSFAKLALPVLALALLALQGGVAGGRVVAGLVGIAGLVGAIVVFALILHSEDLARRFGLWASRVASRLLGLVRRPPVQGWEVATVRFRARTLALLGAGGGRSRRPRWSATCRPTWCCWWRCGMSGSATPRSPGCRCWPGLRLRGC
jgi:hypothetical protein